jgi:hypothetical protein
LTGTSTSAAAARSSAQCSATASSTSWILFVYSLSVGAGKRLFDQRTAGVKYALAAHEAYTSEVLHLTYRPID